MPWAVRHRRSAREQGRCLPGIFLVLLVSIIRATAALDQFGALILVGLFLLLLFLQRKFPLRHQNFSALRRLVRNTLFSASGFALARISLIPFPLLTAMFAGQHHFGVLHLLPIPRWLTITLGVLFMDYLYWWWHSLCISSRRSGDFITCIIRIWTWT